MYYIYIVYSNKDRKMYTGFTENLRKRIYEHQKGLVRATKNRRPLELIYYEAYQNKKDALKREMFLKTGWGRNCVKKILKNCLLSKK